MSNNKSQFWRNALLPLGSTIQQAIRSLEISSVQIVLVVTESGVLVGTLTDGDIRRAFLKGLALESRIDDIIHLNPLVVPPEIAREQVLLSTKLQSNENIDLAQMYPILKVMYVWPSRIWGFADKYKFSR